MVGHGQLHRLNRLYRSDHAVQGGPAWSLNLPGQCIERNQILSVVLLLIISSSHPASGAPHHPSARMPGSFQQPYRAPMACGRGQEDS
jgi:hypothetical protein